MLWKLVRNSAKAGIQLRRGIEEKEQRLFALLIERQRREEEVELALAEEIPPWLLDPKTSKLCKI